MNLHGYVTKLNETHFEVNGLVFWVEKVPQSWSRFSTVQSTYSLQNSYLRL